MYEPRAECLAHSTLLLRLWGGQGCKRLIKQRPFCMTCLCLMKSLKIVATHLYIPFFTVLLHHLWAICPHACGGGVWDVLGRCTGIL